MRLFWAVDPSDVARDEALRIQAALREAIGQSEGPVKVSWSRPEQLHVTLQFLDERPDAAPIVEAVRPVAAAAAPFTLDWAPVGTFGGRAPKVVWLGLGGPGLAALRALAAGVEAALRPLGIAPDHEEGYQPHLTLGRVRGEHGHPGRERRKPRAPRSPEVARTILEAVARAGPPASRPFEVREAILYESRRAGQQTEYVAIARLPLGPG